MGCPDSRARIPARRGTSRARTCFITARELTGGTLIAFLGKRGRRKTKKAFPGEVAMMTYRSIALSGFMWVVASSVSSVVAAQETPSRADSFEHDLRSQPYLYGSIGGFPSGAGGPVTYGLGFGVDFLAYKGLGLGGDVVVFGNQTFSFGVASLTTSYHFVPPSSRLVPFVKAGFGSGGEMGYGGVVFAGFGGGVNLWRLDGAAIRIEIMDRFPTDGGDHHISLQLGITF